MVKSRLIKNFSNKNELFSKLQSESLKIYRIALIIKFMKLREYFRLLLDAGCDVNRTTLRGTALHEAALYGRFETLEFLLYVSKSVFI